MIKKPTRGALAASVLLLTGALVACQHVEPPPPKSGAFSISDKFFDVKALGEGKFVILGYRSKILRSEDNGGSWKPVAQPMKLRSLARLSFTDNNKGWGVGHQGKVFSTQDGGLTWAEQKSGTELSLFDVDFPSATRGYAVGDGSSIIQTSDGGASWTTGKIEMSMIGVREDMSLAIEDPIFYSIDCLDENTCWVVGEFGQIRLTEDGGKTWSAQHQSLLGGMYRDIMALPTILCIRMKDRQNGIGVGTYGIIFVTQDGGTTWKMVQSPVKTPLYDVRYLANGDTVMVGSSGVILVGNPDAGWQMATMPQGVYSWISSLDIDAAGKGVAAGGHGLVLTTGDFGKTWEWKIG